MNAAGRDDAIALALAWLAGLALFAWGLSVSGSWLAAMIFTLIGGIFLMVFIGPALAIVAVVISLLADHFWPSRPGDRSQP